MTANEQPRTGFTHPDQTETIGQRIKQLRQETGLSLRALARAAAISPSYLSGIESGTRRGEIGITKALRLSEHLGVTVPDLVGRSGQEERVSVLRKDALFAARMLAQGERVVDKRSQEAINRLFAAAKEQP